MSVNLGTFKKNGSAFQGTITTLAIKAKLDLIPVEGGGDSSPDYRVQHSGREIGAAWVRRARKSDAEFLNVRVQDPALGPTPVYLALVESTREPGNWALLLNEARD